MLQIKSISDKLLVVVRSYLPAMKNAANILIEMLLQIISAILAFTIVKAVFFLTSSGLNYPSLIIPTTEISKLLSSDMSIWELLNATAELFLFLFVLLELFRTLMRLFRASSAVSTPKSK